MTLASHKPAPTSRPPGCGIARLNLDDADAAELAAWLTDRNYTARAIAEALTGYTGQSVSHQTVQRHRSGACTCP